MVLRGFDHQGQVFVDANRVLRGIFPGQGAACRRVLEVVQESDLFELGIVQTQIVENVKLPGGPYELVLEHEKVPFVSYPHEWSSSMLKDAALFHVDLFLELARHGLTIKDMHPHNIVFDGARPVFVDFPSIIPLDELTSVAYLNPGAAPKGHGRRGWDKQAVFVNEMYRRMFEPYFLLPMEMMVRGDYERARARMLETAMNASHEHISRREVLGKYSLARVMYETERLARNRLLSEADPGKPAYFRALRDYVAALDVAPTDSGYASYYEEKDEAFSFRPSAAWNQKQQTVLDILRKVEPATVLDVAGNTGWFAALAAKDGARVVAFDIDEACADVLYRKARDEEEAIVSLVMDVMKPTPDIAAIEYEDEPERYGDDQPLLLNAARRLKCELVMALAVVHHLVLGQNHTFSQVVDTLDAFTEKHLAVEFVEKLDELIVAERDFFPAYDVRPDGFDWYTEANFVDELEKRFASVDVLPSHPGSRTILLCSRD